FQAEDGIRAFHVTGVQTCALPISEARYSLQRACGRRTRPFHPQDPPPTANRASKAPAPAARLSRSVLAARDQRRARSGGCAWRRSEERRVGKECRSRWSQEHEQ